MVVDPTFKNSTVYNYVNNVLNDFEEEFNIKILYAVESGSRAWGFDNKESDYDIRFIYKKPVEDYLILNQKRRDVIDYNDLKGWFYDYPLDFSGWDISKALFLHYKSNPNLREWLLSDYIYKGNADSLFNDLPTFDKDTVLYHYGSMVNNFWNKYVIGHEGMGKRVTKRYLYCIRCILSYILLKEYNISDVPINIIDLLAYFEEDNNIIHNILLDDIYQLIDYYKNSCENNLSEESIFNLSSFIDKYNKIIGKSIFHKTGFKNLNSYNQRFQELILYG